MKSRKAFTFEYLEGRTRIRTLKPSTDAKFNPENHFLMHEESDYLSEALGGYPYATFRTDEREEMENLLHNGYKDPRGVVWVAFFAYWKDQEGHAFLAPEGAGIKDLRDVGVFTYMKSPADFMKVGKYANRLFAALPKPYPELVEGKVVERSSVVWGKEFSWSGDADGIALVRLDIEGEGISDEDKELSIRYVDLGTLDAEQKALVDGAIIVSEKAARGLGLSKEPTLGMAWRGTFGTERGLGKGHILYKNDMKVDIVIYGPKTILKTNKFFFGSMGELHVGNPHTDRQAYVNFHFHRPGLGVDLAMDYMKRVFESSKNEHELRRIFLNYTRDLEHMDMDEEAWILRRALAYGVSFLRFPGLYRRVVNYLMKKVMQCDERARIPMDTIAQYGYVLPDPNAIDEEGDVHPENAIPEGHLVFPDVKPGTKVVCYRQPSENTNAWVPLTITYRPEYKRFAGRGVCLLGRGANKVLGRLGGGDMDDQFVIIHDPKWVEAFHTMRPYPETEKLSADVTEEEQEEFDKEQTELSAFTEELLEDIHDRNLSHYTNKHVSWQIDMAKNARAGIGPVVNYGMMDMLLSDPDHKASMLADLRNREPEAAEWLIERDDYQAALFMTNLEIVIDGNVKDTTLLRKLGDVSGTIKQFHKDCQVYPASMTNRIPMSKIEQGKYVTARSLTCRSLERIRAIRDRLSEVFVEREYALVTPADRELRTYYPFERELNNRVRGEYKRVAGEWVRINAENRSILEIWNEEWREELAKPGTHEGAYKRIVQMIADELMGEDDDMMERIAVELYFNTYKRYEPAPRVDEATGKYRNYGDGLLWSPVFGNHFINALRKARVTGFYKMAELESRYRSRLVTSSVQVQVRGHNVYILDSEDKFTIWVGIVMGKAPDGIYRMDNGLIEFRAPQSIVQPAEDLIVAQRPITRLFPSAAKPEEVKEAPEPKGFGKLLNKALGILGIKPEDKK